MISWLLNKLSNLVGDEPQEPKLVEGLDYRISSINGDDSMVEIEMLRGPDAGHKIRIMVAELDNENRPADSEEPDL